MRTPGQIEERITQPAERPSGCIEDREAFDLAGMQRLQEASTRLIQQGDSSALYDAILDAAITVMQSDMASMQMLHPARGELALLAQKGFAPSSAAFWEWVRADSGSTCGEALRTGERVIEADVEQCGFMAGTADLDAYRASGIRAVQSTPLLSRTGKPLGMLSTHWRAPHRPAQRDLHLFDVLARQAADLIERTLIETRLRQSEARFRALAESLPQFIWETDAAGELAYVNQRWIDYSGLTQEQTRNPAAVSGTFHPEDAPAIAAAWAQVRATATAMNVEGRIRRRDGEYRCFLIRAEPVLENGTPVRWFGTSTDITDVKHVQETNRELADDLRIRLEEHETLLSALPVGVFIAHDAECTNITMNPAGAAMLRIPFGSNASKTGPGSEGLPFSLLKQGIEVAGEDLPMQRAARLGQPVMAEELDIVFEDGMVATLFEHARPLFDEHGRVRGCVGVFVDVTEHKRAADALKDAGRRKDEFLAILAHELRNPLAALAAASQLLAKASEKPAVAAMAREALQRQVEHMARLLDDLLDVSRITHGMVQLRMERLNLIEAVNAAVETARPQIESRRHRLLLRLPEQPLYVDADRIRLTQIIWNLLSNSAKYTDAGGVIEMRVNVADAYAVIVMQDNGIGIAPEMLAQVFEMFSQATPALQRSEGGLGIGLSLVRGLVRLHAGTVEVHSAGPGRGSEFTVRLPLARSQSEPAKALADADQEKSPRNGLRILIADDNADSANSWAVLLQMAGHEVRTAHDGRQALALADEFQPQLALLDIGMPELNGYDVARIIRSTDWGANATLIAMTGWGHENDKQQARSAGFDHHFTKPVDMSTLEPILAKHVGAAL